MVRSVHAAGAVVRGIAFGLIEAVFPSACAPCGAPLAPNDEAPLCAACAAELADAGEPFCGTCAARGGEPRRCRASAHLRVRAGLVWNDAARAVVHAFKFEDAPELARFLVARAAASPAFADRPRPDVLVPVPLHPVRQRERGYDQAGLLARAFGERLGAVDAGALERVLATRQQARLTRAERARNVARAFRVGRPELVRGRSVALVDDVVTTGATAAACARALLDSDARSVEIWCAAYEPLDDSPGESARSPE